MFRFSGFVACSGQETFGSDVRQTRRITWIAVAVARAAGSASPGAWRCVLVAGSFPSDAAVCQDRMVPPPRVCADPEDVDVGQRFDHLGVAVRAVLDRPLARIQHFGGRLFVYRPDCRPSHVNLPRGALTDGPARGRASNGSISIYRRACRAPADDYCGRATAKARRYCGRPHRRRDRIDCWHGTRHYCGGGRNDSAGNPRPSMATATDRQRLLHE